MRQAAAIAHHCPGFGPPLDMQIDEFRDALEAIVEMNKRADG